MPKKTYAEKINSAKLMVAGLKEYGDRMAKRGLGAAFINNLENLQKNAMGLDSQQEDLKAKLKQKTAELDSRMEDMDRQMSEALKVVKLEMEKESWKSFGIQASR